MTTPRWFSVALVAVVSSACGSQAMRYELGVDRARIYQRRLPLRGLAAPTASQDTNEPGAPKMDLDSPGAPRLGVASNAAATGMPFYGTKDIDVETLGSNHWRIAAQGGFAHELRLVDGDLQWRLTNRLDAPVQITWRVPYRPQIDVAEPERLGLDATNRVVSNRVTGVANKRACAEARGPWRPDAQTVAPNQTETTLLRVVSRMRYEQQSGSECTLALVGRSLLPHVARSQEIPMLEKSVGTELTAWLPVRTGSLAEILEVKMTLRSVVADGSADESAKPPWLAPGRVTIGFDVIGTSLTFGPDTILPEIGLGTSLDITAVQTERIAVRIGPSVMGTLGYRDGILLGLWSGGRIAFDLMGSTEKTNRYSIPLTVEQGITGVAGEPATKDNLRVRVGLGWGERTPERSIDSEVLLIHRRAIGERFWGVMFGTRVHVGL